MADQLATDDAALWHQGDQKSYTNVLLKYISVGFPRFLNVGTTYVILGVDHAGYTASSDTRLTPAMGAAVSIHYQRRTAI